MFLLDKLPSILEFLVTLSDSKSHIYKIESLSHHLISGSFPTLLEPISHSILAFIYKLPIKRPLDEWRDVSFKYELTPSLLSAFITAFLFTTFEIKDSKNMRGQNQNDNTIGEWEPITKTDFHILLN